MTVSTPGHETEETIIYHTEKLIMCTGLASRANPVNIKGVEDFGKPVLNHSQMTVEADLLARDTDAEVITVVGASKTGYDAVHLFASQGKGVDWIVRESGGSGVWMSLPWVLMGPWRVLLEHTATMTFMSWFSPCIWGDFDGIWASQTSLARYLARQASRSQVVGEDQRGHGCGQQVSNGSLPSPSGAPRKVCQRPHHNLPVLLTS